MEDGEEFEQVMKKFLDETDIIPKDSLMQECEKHVYSRCCRYILDLVENF